MRRTIQWIRDNEHLIHGYVKRKAHSAPSTFKGERLSGIIFHKKENARLIYECFHDAVCLQIDEDGRVVTDPFWIVSG